MFLLSSVMLLSKITLHTAATPIIQKYHCFHDSTIFDSLPRSATADPNNSMLTSLGWSPHLSHSRCLYPRLCYQPVSFTWLHTSIPASIPMNLYSHSNPPSSAWSLIRKIWCPNPTQKVPMPLSSSSLLQPHFHQGLGLPSTTGLFSYQFSWGPCLFSLPAWPIISNTALANMKGDQGP